MTPTSLGSFGIGTTLVGGLLSAFGANKQAKATSDMYLYQAQVAKINSDIDKQNAAYARTVGEQNAIRQGLKGGQQVAAIRASKAASGLDVNTGSAADVQRSQEKINEMDLDQIRSNAAKTAYDYEVQSTMDLNQAGLYSRAASNAKSSGGINALASLIGTAGSVSDKWLKGTQMGIF